MLVLKSYPVQHGRPKAWGHCYIGPVTRSQVANELKMFIIFFANIKYFKFIL